MPNSATVIPSAAAIAVGPSTRPIRRKILITSRRLSVRLPKNPAILAKRGVMTLASAPAMPSIFTPPAMTGVPSNPPPKSGCRATGPCAGKKELSTCEPNCPALPSTPVLPARTLSPALTRPPNCPKSAMLDSLLHPAVA